MPATLFSWYLCSLSSLHAHTLAWSWVFFLCCTLCLEHCLAKLGHQTPSFFRLSPKSHLFKLWCGGGGGGGGKGSGSMCETHGCVAVCMLWGVWQSCVCVVHWCGECGSVCVWCVLECGAGRHACVSVSVAVTVS